MNINEIRLRDPFILLDKKSSTYYMYGTNNNFELGFYCYYSKDLSSWNGPFRVFTPDSTFWGTQDFWAPEVHIYNGRYYLIGSFKSPTKCRGCQIFVSDNPLGPFKVHSDVVTPNDWECLDGTLYIENNIPYLIFVHEWLQIKDGEICIIKLSKDLKHSKGSPKTLFKASSASWSKHPKWYKEPINVCDGPFVVKDQNGFPLILWSSFLEDSYDIGYSYSNNGIFSNEYIHSINPLPLRDAGHGMIFTDLNSKKYLVLHADNSISGSEYPVLIPVTVKDKKIIVESKL